MDPLSHSLFGGTLAAAVRPTRPRGVIAACVIGSLLPDIDGFWVFLGFDVYLQHHATETHAFAATPVEALVLAAVLKLLLRGSVFWPMFFGGLAGAAGHIFWDLADGSDMAVLAPFSSAVFGWHLVGMIEPVFIATVILPVLIAWRMPKRARSALAFSGAIVVALLIAKAASQRAAWADYLRIVETGQEPSAAGSLTRIAPVPGSLFTWTIFDRSTTKVRAWHANVRTGLVTPAFERVYARTDALVMASRQLPIVQRFLALDGIPFPRIEQRERLSIVWWSDVRKCNGTTCDVSFGAAFDQHGQPVFQLVQVGPVEQRRDVDR